MAYTKVFSSILGSTVWLEDSDTRVVWFTLLALADKNGEVMGSVPGLAHLARVPVEQCRLALDKFMSPDPDSRTPDYDGRRIEKIDGGWVLVNHAKYRRMASKDDQKEKAAERSRRYRNSVTHRDGSVSITHRDAAVTQDRDIADSDSEAEADKKKDLGAKAPVAFATDGEAERACALFNDAAKRTGWPAVQKFDADRKKLMRARLKDVDGLEGFAIAIGKAEASKFLTTGWPNFNLDWMLKPKNFRKLMEGNYDDRDREDPNTRSLTAGLAGFFEGGSR